MWNRRLKLSRNKVIVRELAVGEINFIDYLTINKVKMTLYLNYNLIFIFFVLCLLLIIVLCAFFLIFSFLSSNTIITSIKPYVKKPE